MPPAAEGSQRVRCKDRWLDLTRPAILGVLNVTPDSFSDGGRFGDGKGGFDLSAVESAARQMVADGAAMLDIGGESTRPGATPVSFDEEIRRTLPVVLRLAGLETLLSIDTRNSVVAREAITAGCHFVNDVSGGRDPDMLRLVAHSGAGLCLMHMCGEPATMQKSPDYQSVCDEVRVFLEQQIERALRAGVREDQIVVDPGIGFGKRLEHNLELLRGIERVVALGFPVMIGVSRKSTIGQITGRDVQNRVYGSVALAVLAAERGVSIIRVHDIAATGDGLAVQQALQRAGGFPEGPRSGIRTGR
ncbi:MAG: dihydropteroate synthase [Gammaproteobacteria bacterium]|nr:dihydropteroate synthase [Gammaproteobacteria bacterium]